jgi:replication-associated recombination protein RarA
MEIINTKDMKVVASFNALIYGGGGVGKTTMASTFPKPLLLDFENGAKYFKSRGIELDTVQFST